MRRVTKLFRFDIKSIDEEKRQVTFCFSDDQKDRDGDVVDQSSWDTKNYEANPIILWKHKTDQPEDVLGQGVKLDLNADGKSWITAQFDDVETNPKADTVFRQVVKRTIRCVSAGFITGKEVNVNGNNVLKDNELLEVSIVPIPSNPRAIARAYKEGSLSDKDARWMLDSMQKEAKYLEEQMEQSNKPKENTMNEKQMSALLAAVTTVAESQAKTNEKLDGLTTVLSKSIEAPTTKGAVTDLLNTDDDIDQKWANMDDASAVWYAFCEAYYYSGTPAESFKELLLEAVDLLTKVANGDETEGEGTVAKAFAGIDRDHVKELALSFLKKETSAKTEGEDTPEDKPAEGKKPDETIETPNDEKKNDDAKDGSEDASAKDGGNDQSGAEDDELDPEAELTDETKALIDGAVEKAEK